MVLEISVQLSSEDELHSSVGATLELAKCGWELELEAQEPCRVGSLPVLPEEVPQLLRAISATINDLAERARLQTVPIGPDMLESLIQTYRDSNPPGTPPDPL